MTPERMAAMEAEAAGEENTGIMRVVDSERGRLDEAQSPVAGGGSRGPEVCWGSVRRLAWVSANVNSLLGRAGWRVFGCSRGAVVAFEATSFTIDHKSARGGCRAKLAAPHAPTR